MKATLISSMTSFVLGTGATLLALSSWLGTSDLQTIKSSVQNYVMEAEQNVGALLGEYNVTVNNANAEIGEYKDALAQANSNIDKLITAYNQAEQEHQSELSELQTELGNANTKYETDMKELQAELDKMKQSANSKYETDMNAIIEQANAQINQANIEVGETKEQVQGIINGSIMSDIAENGERNKLDTTGSKEVTDISSIVPSEQPQE